MMWYRGAGIRTVWRLTSGISEPQAPKYSVISCSPDVNIVVVDEETFVESLRQRYDTFRIFLKREAMTEDEILARGPG
jgi:hypothetical protein